MIAYEIRVQLRKEFGIEIEAQLMEELSKCKVDIGIFVSPLDGGVKAPQSL